MKGNKTSDGMQTQGVKLWKSIDDTGVFGLGLSAFGTSWLLDGEFITRRRRMRSDHRVHPVFLVELP